MKTLSQTVQESMTSLDTCINEAMNESIEDRLTTISKLPVIINAILRMHDFKSMSHLYKDEFKALLQAGSNWSVADANILTGPLARNAIATGFINQTGYNTNKKRPQFVHNLHTILSSGILTTIKQFLEKSKLTYKEIHTQYYYTEFSISNGSALSVATELKRILQSKRYTMGSVLINDTKITVYYNDYFTISEE